MRTYRSADILNALHAFAQATGMHLAQLQRDGTWEGEGLGFTDPDFQRGTFRVLERTERGLIQYPMGVHMRTSISALEHATAYAKAFALTPNLFGEKGVVLVDDQGERDDLLRNLNSAGFELATLTDVDGTKAAGAASRALTCVANAKRIVMKRAHPAGS